MGSESDILFREIQRFRQPWLWGLVILTMLVALFLVSVNGIVLIELVLLSVFPAVFGIFYSAKLTTEVHKDGVYIKFFPFHLSRQHVSFDEIESYRRKKYSPVFDYGGWGIRTNSSRETAYTVSGNLGILLHRSSKPSLMIGTQNPREFVEAIEKANATA
ncbi:MAG: DUF6141 family protein [Halobacteria archaeon]|nr:DUF6141 family protein [Halobacteria archaeon]